MSQARFTVNPRCIQAPIYGYTSTQSPCSPQLLTPHLDVFDASFACVAIGGEMPRWLYAKLVISVFGVTAVTQATEPVAPGSADADLEWIYSCPTSKGCAFSCPTGAGGAMSAKGEATNAMGRAMAPTGGTMAATHVTKLTIHLRWLRIGNEQAQAMFYDYSTMEVPSGSGFAINTGLGALSCQVNGMTLDYFGPPKSHDQRR